ncbi:MAG: Gfo/Idh/MocA family protein, partial [Longimicrobiales bacterium]
MSAREIAIGIVGAGRIAERVHFDVLSRLRGVRVVGVADPAAERRAVAARRFPNALVLSDAARLVADCPLDGLLICSPPATHAEAAHIGIDAGKHVYVEKPLALRLNDARELVSSAQRAGVIAMIGFNYRHHPLVQQLKRALAAGRVGEPLVLRTIFSAATVERSDWERSPASGGGVLLELGSHHFDLARFLFDDEVS